MAQPIQDEVLVELRQLNAETNNKTRDDGSVIAGDFSCPINTPLKIENGDMLNIKSCFVDSVAQNSGKIRINSEDATITINFIYYYMDWGFPLTSDSYNSHRLNLDGHTTPEGKLYYLGETHQHNPGQPVAEAINNLKFTVNYDKFKDSKNKIAKFNLQYENQVGTVVKLHFQIKTKKIKFNSDVSFDIDNSLNNEFHEGGFKFPLIARVNTFQVDTDPEKAKNMRETGVIFQEAIGTPIPQDGNTAIEPKIITLTRTIETGDYMPSDLADTINRAFTFTKDEANQYITGATYSDNPILTTTNQMKVINGGAQPFYVASDKSDLAKFIGGQNFWLGSSQFGIIYDDGDNRFKFASIHSHLYNEHGLTVIKAIGTTPKQFFANKTGGIAFNSLSPSSLWEDKLGFSIANMSVIPQNPEVKTIGVASNVRISSLNLKDGETITGDLITTDTLIQKQIDETAGVAFDRPTNSFGGIETVVQNFISIDAINPLQSSDGDNNTPYYQIEIRGGANLTKLGADKFNSQIGAIISRYYSSDSYTSTMDNSGSIAYQHKGEPIELSELSVRILKPDGTLADDIGTDNTIFLSLIKQK